jgi:ribosomal protein S18 acetylase RimI-like enzyme
MITLEAISPAEYKTWLTQAIRDYADDKVSSGNWEAAEALDRSAAEFHRLLPDGPATPDNFVYSLMAPNADADSAEDAAPVSVGVLWFALPPWKPPIAFIYDFLIYEPYRRHGYGAEALRALEEKVKAMGLDTIGLHVFAHNTAARALYEKAGYAVTDINMAKKLSA